MQQDYNKFVKDIPGFGDKWTFEEFKNAYLTVQTHSYTFPIEEYYEMSFMTPFADLFNMDDASMNNIMMEYIEDKDYMKNGVYMMALTDIDAGTPLRVHYGSKNNAENLIKYGTYDNDYIETEAIRIPGTLMQNDPLQMLKQYVF